MTGDDRDDWAVHDRIVERIEREVEEKLARESLQRSWERSYYLGQPDIMTLREFADGLRRTDRW
ncbi:MAG TPA: hypothetical protein VGJ44_18150 [Kribbellaceae bacterium]|jgi:hypothetical protein